MKSHFPNILLTALLVAIPTTLMAKDNEEVPDLEFLEFLGEWTNSQDEWIDPMLMTQAKKDDSADTDTSKGKQHD